MAAIDLMNELLNPEATASVVDVEQAASSSGELPAGKYHVRLDGVQNKEAGEINVVEMTFVLLAGAHKGRKTRYQLWMGTKETDKDGNAKPAEKLEEDKKRLKNEFWHTAGVLGLAAKVGDGKTYVFATGKRDFRDCLGAECVVETALRAFKDKDGNERKGNEVKMFGVIALNDPKCKDVVKGASGGAVNANGQTAADVRAALKDMV